jgi:hypothetical protein
MYNNIIKWYKENILSKRYDDLENSDKILIKFLFALDFVL